MHILIVVLTLVSPLGADIVFVDADANGLNHGMSWTHAYTALQDALKYADACPNTVEIRIAEGRYTPDRGNGMTPGDPRATFQMRNKVTVRGGYAGVDANDPNERDTEIYTTLLSGNLMPSDLFEQDNSFHVVTAGAVDSNAVLDGVTIRGGNASPDPLYPNGGGIYIDQGSPTLINCRFISNSAFLGGGAYSTGSPALLGCEFRKNFASHRKQTAMGGGMYNDEETQPLLVECVFVNNIATSFGGGLCNADDSRPTITNCTFIGNKSAFGGGMMNADDSIAVVTGCTLSRNAATWTGGGMHNRLSRLTVVNSLFLGNTANDGGGIFNHHGYMDIDRCVFNGNLAYVCGGGICNEDMEGAVIGQSIFWDNIADMGPQIGIRVFRDRGFRTVVRYSNVQGGQWDVYNSNGSLGWSNNINTDPLFAATGYWDRNQWVDGDYHLQSAAGRWDPNEQQWVEDILTSPCIDAGDPESSWAEEPWPHGERINIGAYGGTPKASLSLSEAGQPTDGHISVSME